MKLLGRILLGLLSFLLALGLFCANLYAVSLGTLHYLYSEERIATAMSELDFAAIELPSEEGEISTIGEMMGASIAPGIVMPAETVNSIYRGLSMDKIFTSFLLDLRHWAFEEGPVPRLDAEEILDTALAGMNDELREYLYLSEETKPVLVATLSQILEQVDMNEPLSALEPARILISRGTLVFSLTVVALLFLLLLVTRRLRLCPTMIITGVVCLANSGVFLLLSVLMNGATDQLAAESGLPLSTVELFFRPLINAVSETGVKVALFGIAAILLFGCIGLIMRAIRKRKRRHAVSVAPAPAEEACLSAPEEEANLPSTTEDIPSPIEDTPSLTEEEKAPVLSEGSET